MKKKLTQLVIYFINIIYIYKKIKNLACNLFYKYKICIYDKKTNLACNLFYKYYIFL